MLTQPEALNKLLFKRYAMPIIAFTFDKLSAEKDKEALKEHKGKNIELRHNISIKDVKEEELNIGSTPQKILRFDFEFGIKYQPNIGSVDILGHILYSDSNIKEILKEWGNEKDITDNNLKANLINSIFQKSNLKAISLIQEVNLPLHFPLPRLVPPSKANPSPAGAHPRKESPADYIA